MTALLDTNAYTALAGGDKRLLALLSECLNLAMSSIVVGELEYGFRHGRRYRENRDQLEVFLAEGYVDFLTVTRDITLLYGRISAELRRSGQRIPTNDAWIAAHAAEHDAELWTRDRHFDSVSSIDIRNW